MTNRPSGAASPVPRGHSPSGGGSKKLQQIFGASESDIDILLRPAEIVSSASSQKVCVSVCMYVCVYVCLCVCVCVCACLSM